VPEPHYAANRRATTMFGFLKRLSRIPSAYADGKAYEQWYKMAMLTTMIYVDERCPSAYGKDFRLCVWSNLHCTEPTNSELLKVREEYRAEIETVAMTVLENDEPFREVIVSTLWVGLCMCRAYGDNDRYDRTLNSPVFARYSQSYRLVPPKVYGALIDRWSQKYSPQPCELKDVDQWPT
jgi:hypothetical protein